MKICWTYIFSFWHKIWRIWKKKGNKLLSELLLTVTRGFYTLFIVITWLGISMLSRINRIRNLWWCVCVTDFAEICISLKAPRGLPIHRIKVKYGIFVHPNISKTNQIKENNISLKIFFCHGVDLFCNRPLNGIIKLFWAFWSILS